MLPRKRRGLGIKTKIEKLMGVKTHRIWPELSHNSVGLVYWVPNDSTMNFGDEISRVIFLTMLARKGFTPFDETPAQHTMLAVGSILHFAPDGATVWGSGANVHEGMEREYPFSTLDVRAVRGPQTAAFLRKRGITVPDVYGDPALLLPELFPGRFNATGEAEVGVVPNWADLTLFNDSGLPIIDPMRSWNVCVADILKYRFILSSSLHGLIIAESYGIPARYVRVSDQEGTFKYRDYYESTGRPDFKIARSIEEGLEMGGEPLPVIDTKPLLDAFPHDLWTGAGR